MEVDSEEEMDYMSDAFLVSQTKDVRPGLCFSRVTQKERDQEQRKKAADTRSKLKPRRVTEEEQRSKALSTPLVSSNKGFAMMQKMGFQPGSSLGKPGTSGLVEPIAPVLKSDRGGLGKDTELKRKMEYRMEWKAKRLKQDIENKEKLEAEFTNRIRNKIEEKKTYGYLKKGQKICEYLDCNKGITEPERSYFWQDEESTLGYSENLEISDDDTVSSISETEDEEEEEEEIETPAEKLENLVEYLRRAHCYCIWCATSFQDEDDLNANCPGPTARDHE